MARMIPTTPQDFHCSNGERRVFRALRSLPDDIVVIHSLRWLHPGTAALLSRHLGAQGEGDFVLIDPARGILVIEVKGGEVWCDQGEWFKRNRATGHSQAINPEAQASNTMFRIRSEVAERIPAAASVLFCHAVWFPDGAVNRDNLPLNYHSHMTLDAEDVALPEAAIQRVFSYWKSLHPKRIPPGSLAKTIVDALAPTLSIVRSVRQTLDEREELLVRLNREQAKLLEFLDEQLHVAIHGAAGTGKTLLAVEKARRIATPTEPVLFLCFNAALRDHLRANHANPNVAYHTFHGLARKIIGPAGSLEDAVQSLLEHLGDDKQLPFTHLVVDEGQDFNRDWLEYLKYGFRNGAFYIFYDRYQAIQGQKDASWINDIPCRLVLTRNCRNTDPIARTAYRAGGLQLSPKLDVAGPQPVLHTAEDISAAIATANSLITSACAKHKVPPHEIAVLSLDTIGDESPWRISSLGGFPTSEFPKANHVTVTTARRFKGLEATLVLVVDVDFARATDEVWRLLLYVACSRARHAVHILSTTKEADLGSAVLALAGSEKARPSWRGLCRLLGVQRGGDHHDPFNEPRTG